MNNPADNQMAKIKYLDEPGALEDSLRLGRAGIWRWQIDSEKLDWTRNLESVLKRCLKNMFNKRDDPFL